MQEFIERDLAIAITVQNDAHLEEVVDLACAVKLGELKDEISDPDRLRFFVRDVSKDIENGLSCLLDNVREDLLEELYRLLDSLRDLIVLVTKLYLFEN